MMPQQDHGEGGISGNTVNQALNLIQNKMKIERYLPFLHDSACFCKKFQPMKLILEIKNPGEWELLLAFCSQRH